jgi:autotransporter-associated beta strand protein
MTDVAPPGAASAKVILEFYSTGSAPGSAYCDDFTFGPAAGGPSTLVAGSISNSGTLSIGPANTVTIDGGFSQASTGTLDIQLGGGPSTGSFGFVNVSGAATLAGTLKADVVNGYAPSTTDTFTPVEFASETGSFAAETMPSGTGYAFNAAVTFTNLVIGAAPTTALTATVNAATTPHAATTNLLGINLVYWDTETPQTGQMLTAAGLDIYRFPGGSAADDYHFNNADNYYSGAETFVQYVQAIAADGGTGMITLDYGSGSPQEAAAELAYLDGSPTDATSIGNGSEWNDTAGAWQTVNWGTVGYWAALRGAAPLATDDGLNFLRIAHPAAFTDVKYWEVGNEEYGSWEVDHHALNSATGAADPATYAAFAAQFAALAGTILKNAGLPQSSISIGIDSGDPTGAGDDDWTKNVLADGLADGFVPGFISDHSYMQAAGGESDSFLLDDTVTDSGSVLDWTTRYADYASLLTETLGGQAAGVQVLATEYNSVAPGSVYTAPGKQSTSLVNGLFVAESLGGLLDSGYSGGFVWDLRNDFDTSSDQNDSNLLYGWRKGGDYGQLGDPNDSSPPTTGPYVAYPGYYALQLASKIIQSGGQVVSAASNYGDLDVYAVKEPSGDLDLLVINVNPAASLTEQFDLTGFQPGGAAQVWQYGEAQDTAQSHSGSGASALSDSSTTLSLSGTNFSYAFPAYSMTVLDLAYRQIFTSVAVSPGSSSLQAGGSQQFSASARDQFGNALASQPAFTWSLTGGGSLTAGGLYTPPYASGSATVMATSGAISGTATVTFTGQAQWVANAAAPWTANGDWENTVSGSAIAAPGLRGIAGDTVLLGPSAAGPVDLNGASPSLAAITFNTASGATIAPGTGSGSLLLNNGASAATITVSSGNGTIGASLLLAGNLLLEPAAGSMLDISGAISGAGSSLTQDSGGKAVLSGTNSYTGGTVVEAGTLVLSNSSAIAAGTSLTIGANAPLLFAAVSASDPADDAANWAVDAVFAQYGRRSGFPA